MLLVSVKNCYSNHKDHRDTSRFDCAMFKHYAIDKGNATMIKRFAAWPVNSAFAHANFLPNNMVSTQRAPLSGALPAFPQLQ